MKDDFVCVNTECRSPGVRHAARGLCRTCYSRAQVDGTASRWECVEKLRGKPRRLRRRTVEELNDERYERWIRKGDRLHRGIPVDGPRRWLLELNDRLGLRDSLHWGERGRELLAQEVGIDQGPIRRMLDGSYANAVATVREDTAERIALAAGRLPEFADLVPPQGKEGWSPTGEYCEGCGAFHHPHHAEGLCEECHVNRDNPDFEARDVRVTRKVREEKAAWDTDHLQTA